MCWQRPAVRLESRCVWARPYEGKRSAKRWEKHDRMAMNNLSAGVGQTFNGFSYFFFKTQSQHVQSNSLAYFLNSNLNCSSKRSSDTKCEDSRSVVLLHFCAEISTFSTITRSSFYFLNLFEESRNFSVKKESRTAVSTPSLLRHQVME